MLINNEKVVQLAIKRALLNTFVEEPGKFQLVSINRSVKNHSRNDESGSEEDEDDEIVVMPTSSNFASALRMFKSRDHKPNISCTKRKNTGLDKENNLKLPKIDKFFTQTTQLTQPTQSLFNLKNIPSEELIEDNESPVTFGESFYSNGCV